MGNKNCTTWSSILFPENEEEERWNEWMKEENSVTWEYIPLFPSGTEILPVQPVYKPDVRELQFSHENEKASRKRSYFFSEKDSRCKSGAKDAKGSRNGQKCMKDNDDNENIVKDEWNLETNEPDEPKKDTFYQQQSTKRRFPTGRVYISISHDPITRRIKLAIIKAKNLSCKQTVPNDKCGINCAASYMDAILYEGDRAWQSYTTGIKKGYSEVLYYEHFAFDTNNLNLRGTTLEITAKHSSKRHFRKQNHDIGKIVLKGQTNDDTMIDSHLVEAIIHPGHTLYKWHTLWSY